MNYKELTKNPTGKLDENMLMNIDKARQIIGKDTIIEIGPEFWDPKEPTDFFLRPEDTDLYEPCSLSFPDSWSSEKKDAFLRIYLKERSWPGDLALLFPNLRLAQGAANKAIDGHWGERRLNCGLKCYEPGHSCHFCETALHTAQLIKQKKKEKESE